MQRRRLQGHASSSTSYRVGKKCVPIDSPGAQRDHDPEPHRARPRRRRTSSRCCAPGTASSSSGPRVGGKPVALVLQRSTYGHEVDSVLGFGEFNDPGFVHDAKSLPEGRERHRLHVQLVLRRRRRTSPTTPPGCCRSARRRSSRTCRTGPARSTTGRAGCRSRSTPTRPTRSAATWSAGTTSRRPTSRPPTTTGATARSTARWPSRSGCCRRSRARRRSTCPAWSA